MAKAAAGYPRSSTISSPGVLVEEGDAVVVDHCRPWQIIFFSRWVEAPFVVVVVRTAKEL